MAKNSDSHCTSIAKTGKRCRAAATAGGLCYFHANPKKASELGRIGGRRKRSATAEDLTPLPKLETASAVPDAVGQLIADVHAGKMNSRVAANLAPLLNLQLRAIETTDIERRLIWVENLLAKTKGSVGADGNAIVTKRNGSPDAQNFDKDRE